jgi:hypothetical protein
MINWREKIVATAVHFVVTLLLAGIAAALIFLVWYPDPFQKMTGGTELFLLVVGCDLALGPLMSLVIFNSRKSRRELVIDYSVVGVVQLAALVYGVFIVAGARPAYLAYSKDRFEVVTAGDLTETELAAATDPQYRNPPWTGPRLVAVVVPPEESQDAMFKSLEGNEEHMRPRFYVQFEKDLASVHHYAKSLQDLEKAKPQAKVLLDRALEDVKTPREKLAWVPIRHRQGFWTAILDAATGKPVAYIDLDPY